jgi:hypothetical protein
LGQVWQWEVRPWCPAPPGNGEKPAQSRIRAYGVFDGTTGPQPDFRGTGGKLSVRKIGKTGERKAGLGIHLPETVSGKLSGQSHNQSQGGWRSFGEAYWIKQMLRSHIVVQER